MMDILLYSMFSFFFSFFSCLFVFSCLSRILAGDIWFWEFALVFVTRISKNTFCPFRQTLVALISGLASSPFKPLMFSPFTGCKWGSISTWLCTYFIRFASKSLMLLCLTITNPPRLQFSPSLTLYCWPYGHW